MVLFTRIAVNETRKTYFAVLLFPNGAVTLQTVLYFNILYTLYNKSYNLLFVNKNDHNSLILPPVKQVYTPAFLSILT
jgi:hypothetical protein